MASGEQQQRKALIIGAGSGMGAAVAKRFHDDGYSLMLADINLSALDEAKERYGADTAKVDLGDDSSIVTLAERCASGVDALVITAGLSMSMAPFERIMDVNLGGSARVLKQFSGVVRAGGAVVCLASIAGHMAGEQPEPILHAIDEPLAPNLVTRTLDLLSPELRVPGMAYALSKLGVLRLVKRSAAIFGQQGVRICSVSPGLIETPMGKLERDSNPGSDEAVQHAPIPRLGQAEEVAAVISFLCSSQASYLTGIDIIIDGGWVAASETAAENSPIAQAMSNARAKN